MNTEDQKIFKRALDFVLSWEGGYSNHPLDPGGNTNFGITQAAYDAWRLRRGLAPRVVVAITPAEVEDFYRELWAASKAETLASSWPRVAVVVFDLTVQSGTGGATQLAQRALGQLAVDGVWGQKTQARLEQWLRERGDTATAVQLISERVRFRGERVSQQKNQLVFLRGWLNRDVALVRLVVSWPG